MTKYIAPAAAVSALYSVWRGWTGTDPIKVQSIEDAVTCLNENRNVAEAVRFMTAFQHTSSASFMMQLSTRSNGILAGLGSDLVNHVSVERCIRDATDPLYEKALSKIKLGGEWQSTIDWLHRVPCLEEDLSCEEALYWRPSQITRLERLLKLLLASSENSNASTCMDVDAVDFLFNIYAEFTELDPNIALLALRILSNISLLGSDYAQRIFVTEWLPTLSHLVGHGSTLMVRLLAHKICRNALHSLGAVPYKLLSDVYELHVSHDDPLLDIVMIHGLRGSVQYTWRQKDDKSRVISDCWPKDWIPYDIKEPMRILGIDYQSFLLNMSGAPESLQARSERFIRQLQGAGVGTRPIVFICHSMGGLLAKRLLLDSEEWRQKTVGILFIATPHRGSPLAAWGDYSFLAPSEDVQFLHANNQMNEKLNADFAVISESIPVIASILETKESNLIGTAKGVIVPTESAVFGRGVLYQVDEVHHNVCKPKEKSSPSYGIVLNFLRDSIVQARKVPVSSKPLEESSGNSVEVDISNHDPE